MSTTPHRFTILIHWYMAALVLALLIMGFYMVNTSSYSLYSWHKSLGVVAAVAIAIRLYYRSHNRWISNARGSKLEGVVRLAHGVILTLLVLMPFTGFILSGLGGYGVALFGFEIIPSNFNANGEAVAFNKTLSELGYTAHSLLAILLSLLVALHIAAAVKHHLFDKDQTLLRMLGQTRK